MLLAEAFVEAFLWPAPPDEPGVGRAATQNSSDGTVCSVAIRRHERGAVAREEAGDVGRARTVRVRVAFRWSIDLSTPGSARQLSDALVFDLRDACRHGCWAGEAVDVYPRALFVSKTRKQP